MPTEDANKWNIRYEQEPRNSFEQPRALLVDHAHLLPKQGLALDLAMGLGGNAGFLLRRGLRVIGVDISYVAVNKAHSSYPGLMAIVADLHYYSIPRSTFDLIIDFLYLQRNLWPQAANGLKKGGWLFVECLTEAMLSVNPGINPAFLLRPGELQQTFQDAEFAQTLEILYSSEGWQATTTSHPKSIASLIARRYC